MTRALIASTIVSIFMVACAAEDANDLSGGRGNGPGGGGVDSDGDGIPDDQDPTPNGGGDQVPGETPPGPGQCVAQPHVGFANTDFVADRKPGEIGINRRRVKPYTALRTEFQRALGTIPAGLATNQAAFGQDPARWYSEPVAGAVSLYTTYNIAFTGCYDTMTDAKYNTAPTQATADAECAALQRKMWQRTSTPDEVKACSDFTLGLTTETNARRRWAHACASIMASAGFTTY